MKIQHLLLFLLINISFYKFTITSEPQIIPISGVDKWQDKRGFYIERTQTAYLEDKTGKNITYFYQVGQFGIKATKKHKAFAYINPKAFSSSKYQPSTLKFLYGIEGQEIPETLNENIPQISPSNESIARSEASDESLPTTEAYDEDISQIERSNQGVAPIATYNDSMSKYDGKMSKNVIEHAINIEGASLWTHFIGTYDNLLKTATLTKKQIEKEKTEPLKVTIEFTDVTEFSKISSNEIMRNPIVKEKNLIYFARFKNPNYKSKDKSNIEREYVSLWGQLQ